MSNKTNLKPKSVRVTRWLLEGQGMYARGYWVDWHRQFVAMRSGEGFELIEFKSLPGILERFAVKSVTPYPPHSLDLLQDHMRRIAFLSRWYEYDPERLREIAEALEAYRVRP
jgi:hypothetical protein